VATDAGATVLLLSDGMANVGVCEPEQLEQLAAGAQGHRITTTTLGLGLGCDEVLLSAIARGGAGSAHFAEEARRRGRTDRRRDRRAARKHLRQVPSIIYWSGLERWGIRRQSGSREQWARSVARSSGAAVDDDGQLVSAGARWWHYGLPEPPEDWPMTASLALRVEAGEYLRERISERCAETVLAVLAERREPWEEVPFAWQLDMPELTDAQRRLVAHARRFSETMHCAALLYNRALAQGHENDELDARYREQLEQWVQQESPPTTATRRPRSNRSPSPTCTSR
jgi:hypothetical protein